MRSLCCVFLFVRHFALGIGPMLTKLGINIMPFDHTPAPVFLIPTMCGNNMEDFRTWETAATIAPRTSFPLNGV
jgi:hypothetical protein